MTTPVSSDHEQRRRGIAEYQAILHALTKRDPDAAERTMRDHIRHTKEVLGRRLG
jgi:DNA-binding GntR family transcriptional regulator